MIYRDAAGLGGNDGTWDGGTYEDSEWIVLDKDVWQLGESKPTISLVNNGDGPVLGSMRVGIDVRWLTWEEQNTTKVN